MNEHVLSRILLTLLLAGMMAGSGCGGDNDLTDSPDDGSTPPSTDTTPPTDTTTPTDPPSSGSIPKIAGAWRGTYYTRGYGLEQPGVSISAQIRQDGDAVIINTTLTGVGANLTGTIDSDGDMRLTDAYDGEIWTTHYRPATPSFIQIADFLRPPELGDLETPIQIMDLVPAG